MFGLPWKRQDADPARIAAVETELAECQKQLRELRLELVEIADRVYRHMKAAAARSRAKAEPEGNQGTAAASPPDTPRTAPLSRVQLRRQRAFGARGRQGALDLPVHEVNDEGATNGVA